MSRKMVYIASPYTIGCQKGNVLYQIDIFDGLLRAGYVPIAPLLSHFVNEQHPHTYSDWMQYDFEVIKRCDVLLALRMDDPSEGRDKEISFAKEIGVPVVYSVDELYAYSFRIEMPIRKEVDARR